MKHAPAIVSFALFAALPLAAQSTYDDFSSTSLDQNKWVSFGTTKQLSQSGGALKINGQGVKDEVGVFAIDGLRGNFELIVEFKNFVSHSSNGAVFTLVVQDAIADDTKGGEASVEIGQTSQGLEFWAEAQHKDQLVATAGRATTVTAGKFRLRRFSSPARLEVSVQEPNKAWQVLGTWQNKSGGDLFVTDTVRFSMISEEGAKAGASVDVDRVAYVGTLVKGSPSYGKRCLDLVGAALTFPVLGAKDFTIAAAGGASFAKAPFLMTIGSQSSAIDLTAAGAPGCSLYTPPILIVVGGVLDEDGFGGISFGLPTDSKLRGLVFFAQMIGVTKRNALGLAWSDGIRCTLR